MTTELEKTFFNKFGIEPKETITCVIEEDWLNDYHLKTWYPISDWMKHHAPCKGEKECSDKCNCYQVKNTYPQITDRHYLEFICITRRYALKLGDTISETKNLLLRFLIDNNTLFKHKVQAIFEGER